MIGKLLKTECNTTVHPKQVGRLALIDLSEENKTLLRMHSNFNDPDMTWGEICQHHFKYFLSKYEWYQRKYADPGEVHKKLFKAVFTPLTET